MYVAKIPTYTSTGKLSHTAILLRRSYREDGKIKTETIGNLNHCSEEEIRAIEWALKHKGKLDEDSKASIKRKTFKSFGAVYLVKEILKKLSIEKVLGQTKNGKLAQLQVISRTINQGSCLSTIRIAETRQALCEVLDIEDRITEDDLYTNLSWLSKHQRSIEQQLYNLRYKVASPEIFLYDVTSSYFEGTHNSMSNWGYNRDKKKGKMQVVAGLLCDESGYPIAIRLFEGNTLDFLTVHEQVKQVSADFGCRRVTFVGDRGMLKSKQIEELEAIDFYYITAITKPQMETLVKDSVIQMGLFDQDIKEVEHAGVRYILKRNPLRAKEIEINRQQKKQKIDEILVIKNEYLKNHNKSKLETAKKAIEQKIKKLKIDRWLSVEASLINERELIVKENLEELASESKFDGCYVIKSNLPNEISKVTIHDRYKELSKVESAFKSMKTEDLELRPWFVTTEASTRGHAFEVMLSYMVIKYLREAWKEFNITVNEGLSLLDGLSLLEVKINGACKYYEVPEPSEMMEKLLKSAEVKLPELIPYKKVNVSSRNKLVRRA